MFDHLRDITLRNPEDDVTEYVDSLDKHIKNKKGCYLLRLLRIINASSTKGLNATITSTVLSKTLPILLKIAPNLWRLLFLPSFKRTNVQRVIEQRFLEIESQIPRIRVSRK